MAYCYECGSEVAPIDAFCPFCGISLKPYGEVVEEESEGVSALATGEIFAPTSESVKPETTVETTSREISDLAQNSGQPEAEPTISEIDFATANTDENLNLPTESGENDQTENSFKPAGDSNFQADAEIAADETPAEKKSSSDDFSDIPTPSLIENMESFSAGQDSRNRLDIPAEKRDFGLVEESDGAEIKADEPREDRFLENAEAKPEDSAPENYAADVRETGNAELNNAASNVETDFGLTIPDVHSPQTESTELQTDETSEKQEQIKETGEVESSETESESDSSAEKSIEKPADEDLEPFDPNSSAPSVYDSVKIMEGGDSFDKTPPAAAENLEPIHISKDRTPPEIKSPEIPVESENLSHTTPNIGGSDTDGKKAAKLKPLDEGTILNNRYEIIRKIGGGGMGAVYLASDNNLGGVLRAVKEMVQSYIEEEQQEKSVNDFKRESTILSTLEHNSIPTIYDYFYDEKESRFYLVMKYINGGDLSGRLRAAPEGKIDEKTITEWSIQIADVLDYLHNRPNTIVYRDLKPANVMIDGNSGRIMLIDFGIARSINKEEKGVTAVGTMGYAPPELFSGNVEARSDIYSLGSTMFHLLTGADPQTNPLLIFDFQKNPRPRQINPLLSDQMERILMKAVEYNSTARFGSANELKKCLEEHLENLKTGRVTFGIKEVPQSVSLANQLVFCGFCGQKIVASDMFCAFCGSKQPLSQQGVHAEIYSSAAPQTAKLMILGTNELESPIFSLEKDESFVGRRDPQSGIFPEVDLSKFDPQTKISRRHARIWRDGGNFLVEDLGSSNGTVVMPVVSDLVRLLPHQPHILASGDKIRIGDTTLHFVRG